MAKLLTGRNFDSDSKAPLDDNITDKASGMAIGITVLIVVLGIATLIVGIWGGVHAMRNCRDTLGILAIVFTFLFPPVGFILGIVGFAMKTNCSKTVDLITKNI